jgi:hypothetical protein
MAAVPVLAFLVMLPGCGGGGDGKKKPGDGKAGVTSPAPPVTPAGVKSEVAATGAGTLKGKVVLVGTPPAPADLKVQMEKQQDKSHCLPQDPADPTWTLGAGQGVANVIVWLRPPADKFFKVPAELLDKAKTDVVTVDQPFCAFKPHVSVAFPTYYDPEIKDSNKQHKTGQVVKVLNSAPISHNTNWTGSPRFNAGRNLQLKPKSGDKPTEEILALRAGDQGQEDLIILACNIHPWMKAYIAVIDHPFAAVTDKDGNYEIKNAPAGAEVEVAYWHETFGTNLNAAKREKITLQTGDNEKHFEIKK